jgi:curli biogenesis system outer membrane secretion channel CsgG
MSRFLALLAVIALMLAPASTAACNMVQATQTSTTSAQAQEDAMARPMTPCAEHSSKHKSGCDTRCALACTSMVAINAPSQGAGLSAPAEHGPAEAVMGTEVLPRHNGASLLDRPPKFTT